jgi:hypothetical protein
MFFKTDDHETLALLERATRNALETIDARRLFAMHRNQAVCHLTVGDDSIDAILDVEPLFVAPDCFNSGISSDTAAIPAELERAEAS